MPYHFGFDGPLLVITLSGTLSAADLDGLATELIAIEQGGTNTPPRLTDLRTVEVLAIGYSDVSRFAEVAVARPLTAPVRSALLVREPVQLGYARMFQTLNRHPRVALRVFEDEEAARAWLAGSDTDPGLGGGQR